MFALLQQSFPLDEYRDAQGQRALLERKEYTVYAYVEDACIRGILAVWEFADIAFIEHFAVAEACRNRGLGSCMLEALRQLLQEKTLCLEAEPPVTELACRRIGFYRRNGFFLNDFPYTQPALGADRAPVPLRLMTTGGPATREMLETIKNLLYTRVYGKT